MDGQMTIFDFLPQEEPQEVDMTYDRNGKGHPAPKWMKYERCENCKRWNKYPTDEQPPFGWGVVGWCAELKGKVGGNGYCNSWEDRK